MKRLLVSVLLLALLACVCCPGHAAELKKDYSKAGWYRVYTVLPEDMDYSYMYNKPSSSSGKNLGRIDDDEYVYVSFVVKKSSEHSWAYCEYDGKEGYVRFENLVYDASYDEEYARGIVNAPEYLMELFYEQYPEFVPVGDDWDDEFDEDEDYDEELTVADCLVAAGTDIYEVVNCKSKVSAYMEADSDTDRLQYFHLGDEVRVVGTWKKWILCVCDEFGEEDNFVCGWVKSKYLEYLRGGDDGDDDIDGDVEDYPGGYVDSDVDGDYDDVDSNAFGDFFTGTYDPGAVDDDVLEDYGGN